MESNRLSSDAEKQDWKLPELPQVPDADKCNAKEPVQTGSLMMQGMHGQADATLDPFLMNGASLAYIGDAVYEILVREYVLRHGSRQADRLHKHTVQLVNAKAQSDMIRALLPELTETESAIFRRGRNAATLTAAKHQSVTDYRRATGLEALFGYLYLNGEEERMQQLFMHGMRLLEGTHLFT